MLGIMAPPWHSRQAAVKKVDSQTPALMSARHGSTRSRLALPWTPACTEPLWDCRWLDPSPGQSGCDHAKGTKNPKIKRKPMANERQGSHRRTKQGTDSYSILNRLHSSVLQSAASYLVLLSGHYFKMRHFSEHRHFTYSFWLQN